MNKLSISIGLASKRGPRERNEDAAAVSVHHDFLAIADGIGGAPLGDVASTLCCNAALRHYDSTRDLEAAFAQANAELIGLKELLWTHNCATSNLSPLTTTPVSRPEPEGALSLRQPGAERVPHCHGAERAPRRLLQRTSPTYGTGCTLLLAELADGSINFTWAGDTIALRLHDGTISTVAAPDNVGDTNELGSAVGYVADMSPLRAASPMAPGDRFLLCTDGVWGELDPSRIAELLATSENAPWLAEVLTKEAAEHGHDNATAIVIVVGEGESDEALEGGEPEETAIPPITRTPCYPAISYL